MSTCHFRLHPEIDHKILTPKVEVLYTTETIYDTNGESDTLIYIKEMHLNGFLTQCGYYDGYQECIHMLAVINTKICSLNKHWSLRPAYIKDIRDY